MIETTMICDKCGDVRIVKNNEDEPMPTYQWINPYAVEEFSRCDYRRIFLDKLTNAAILVCPKCAEKYKNLLNKTAKEFNNKIMDYFLSHMGSNNVH